MSSQIAARYALRELMGLLLMGAALFGSAGRMDWWPAWALLALMAAWSTATAAVILRSNPSLLAERMRPGEGAKRWDLAMMSVVGLTTLARLIVAGLDQRFGWTGEFPVMVQVAALGLSALGYALVVWATAANAYFSQIVRIQTDRGHSVVSGGPYASVRHPGYLGSILYELAVPVLLASWWALLIGVVNAALFVLRTILEDRTLRAELRGYDDYAERVRYRLVPGVW